MPADPSFPPGYAGSFDDTLGIEVVEIGEDRARARFAVEQKVKQPFGIVHGGALTGMSESLCSVATWAGVQADGMAAMGMSNLTSFMRPVTEGTVHADARRRHRGRATWVWDVDLTDDEGRLCAVSRVTIAVRPAPAGA